MSHHGTSFQKAYEEYYKATMSMHRGHLESSDSHRRKMIALLRLANNFEEVLKLLNISAPKDIERHILNVAYTLAENEEQRVRVIGMFPPDIRFT